MKCLGFYHDSDSFPVARQHITNGYKLTVNIKLGEIMIVCQLLVLVVATMNIYLLI